MSIKPCRDCHADVIIARTLPGGNLQPLDLDELDPGDVRGTVAVRRDHLGGHYARTLTARDAYPLEPHERRHIPHAATCPQRDRTDDSRSPA